MQIWESRRWRRRFVLGTIFAVLVTVGYLAVRSSNPGDPGGATGPEVPDYVQPKNSPFTASEKQAVSRSLKEFISSAVARENPSRAWDVSAPSLKQGVSRKKWNKGDLPVVPYPAAKRGLGTWSFVEYSYTDSVMLEVFVFPKPGSGWSAMTADVELLKQPDGRWLVDYWMPKRFHGPPALAASQLKKAQKETRVRSKSSRRRAAVEEEPYRPPQASHWWFALPIAILSLIVIVPLTLGLVYWYRNRKATRAYLDSARGRT
jgi:hypothetical protein